MPHLIEQSACGVDIQGLRLGDPTAVVEQAGDQFYPALVAVEHTACIVGDTGRFKVHIGAQAVDLAALVIQGITKVQTIIGLALQRALLVVEGAGSQVESTFLTEDQTGLLVVYITSQQFDNQVFLAGQGALVAVVQITVGESQIKLILAGQLTATVIQTGRIEQQGRTTGQARVIGVDQCTAQGAFEGSLADQLPSAVVHAPTCEGDIGSVDFAVTVAQLSPHVVEIQISCGRNQTVITVVQTTRDAER